MDNATPETAVVEVKKEVTKFQRLADAVQVTNEEQRGSADKLATAVKAEYKRVEAMRRFFVDPLNEQVKKINALFKMTTDPLDQILRAVDRKIKDFLLEEDRKARAEEDRKLKIRQAADAKREAEGKETIATPINAVGRPDITTKSDEGRRTAKKVVKFRIVSENSIPRAYCTPDEKKIRAAVVVNGMATKIEGVEVYEDFDISTTVR